MILRINTKVLKIDKTYSLECNDPVVLIRMYIEGQGTQIIKSV